MDNIEDAAFERALRFLWEKGLEQLGVQADITIIKKSEPEKEDVS